MRLAKLQKFITDCQKKDIELPEGLEVVIEDYEDVVPDEYRDQGAIEYNQESECKTFSSRVQILSAKKVIKGFELQLN